MHYMRQVMEQVVTLLREGQVSGGEPAKIVEARMNEQFKRDLVQTKAQLFRTKKAEDVIGF